MPRQPRLDFPGAFHHVMNRGAARQITYIDALDKEYFLGLLAKAVDRTGIELLAFCLMNNHYHLFFHSPNGQLSSTMKYLGEMYTRYFNQRHGRDGALFRGRFHSVVVDSEVYFARLVRYIELNPVEAGLCRPDELRGFRWSSFRYNSEAVRAPAWLARHHLLERFGSAAAYRDFVLSNEVDSEVDQFFRRSPRRGAVLGGSEFVSGLRARFPEYAEALSPATEVHPNEIETLVSGLAGIAAAELRTARQGCTPACRRALLVLAAELTELSSRDLADRYGYKRVSDYRRALGLAQESCRGEAAELTCIVREVLGPGAKRAGEAHRQ